MQPFASCLQTYFSQIDSLRSATTFVPHNFVLFIAIFIHFIIDCKVLQYHFKMPQQYHRANDQDREKAVERT